MPETFISVDCEAGGATPDYNLCSIGACEVDNISNGFYVELKPINPDIFNSEALAVGGFTIESMTSNGTEPLAAMIAFSSWLRQFTTPKMIGFNAAFDWQFINYYFWRFTGQNPFGINALDIKALYMGFTGCEWRQTTKRSIPGKYHSKIKHTHNALDDAMGQAELFSNILRDIRSKNGEA